MQQSGSSSTNKKKPSLSVSFEKNLLAYAAAASAASIGIMAAAQPADAEIVYTPSNVRITSLSPGFALDLDHDGNVDFNLIRWKVAFSIAATSFLNVCHAAFDPSLSHQCVSSSSAANHSNLVLLDGHNAAALQRGAKIGEGQPFGGSNVTVYMGGRHILGGSYPTSNWNGPWANGGEGVTNRYLGFKFKIDGQYHFGWARISFRATDTSGIQAFVTGYAYETTAEKGLLAGQRSEGSQASNVKFDEPAPQAQKATSLGNLALGADGISLWRKEDRLAN